MKRLIGFAFLACLFAAFVHGKEKELLIRVTNRLQLDRQNEIVTLGWKDVKSMLPNIEPGRLMVRDIRRRNKLVCQIVDTDQDGTPDELIFRSDFRPKETKSFVIVQAKQASLPTQSLTDARFVLPREDVAWENDRIAYRIYGPALTNEVNNGIDVWCKRVRYLVVEKWYKADEGNKSGKNSYHEDRGEGADFFSVGRSLGCGSSALWDADTLLQPGVFASYKVIATGPLRAIFDLSYSPVQFQGRKISETKRIHLDAGQNLNKIEVIYKCDSCDMDVAFAAGLVKRNGTQSSSNQENGWLSLWGPTTDTEENGYLGTGIVMPEGIFREFKEDKSHYLTVGRATLGKSVTFYSGAGWTRSGDFRGIDDWNRYLKEFALKLRSPLELKLELRQK
jgi:pectinesterase